MARVLGVGGGFFKAADVAAPKAGYARVLGFEEGAYGVTFPPLPPGGQTVWSPFAPTRPTSRHRTSRSW